MLIVFSLYIYFGIVLANIAYLRMHNYFLETYAICLRIEDRIEMTEGFTGDEDIILLGEISGNDYFNRTGIKPIPLLDGLYNAEDARNDGIKNSSLPDLLSRVMGFSPECRYCLSEDELKSDYDLTGDQLQSISELEMYPSTPSSVRIGNRIFLKIGTMKAD
jgi:hypothetical protein